jgi:hypothetical protein
MSVSRSEKMVPPNSEKPANRHVVTVAKVAKCCWRGTRVVPGMVAFLLLVGVAYAGES